MNSNPVSNNQVPVQSRSDHINSNEFQPAFKGRGSRLTRSSEPTAKVLPSGATMPAVERHRQLDSYHKPHSISLTDSQCNKVGGTLCVQQAFNIVSSVDRDQINWKIYALLFFVPYDKVLDIDSSNLSNPDKLKAVLQFAFRHITSDELFRAIAFIHRDDPDSNKVERAGISLRCYDVQQPIPTYCVEKPCFDDKISPRDAYIFCNLLHANKTLYSLKCYLPVEMALPPKDRLELQDFTLDGPSFCSELFWRADKQGLLTLGNLMSALKAKIDQDVVREICDQVGVSFDKISQRQPDYKVYPDDRVAALSQRLSLRDCVVIFAPLRINDHLIWATGPYDNILELSTLLRRHNQSLETIHVLEKIYEKKGFLTADQVIRILYKPEVLKIASAHQLENKLTGRRCERIQLSHCDLYEISEKLSLSDSKLTDFGIALGIPAHCVKSIINGTSEEKQYEIMMKAWYQNKATPENIIYAINQVCQDPECVTRLPCLKEKNGCKLPPDDPCYLSLDELGNTLPAKGSVPLTMEILSDLPLTYNWFWIGMGLGIPPQLLSKIKSTGRHDSAYQLACCLSKPDRQLQTGHLYQTLQFLRDPEGLRTFPEHLKGKPTVALSEQHANCLMRGRKLILLATALSGENLYVLAEQLGLKHRDVDDLKADPTNSTTKLIVIQMLLACEYTYGEAYIDKFMQNPSDIDLDALGDQKHL